MKKAMLLALCLILAGLLAVNGTFAAEFTQAVGEAVGSLFKMVEGLVASNPTADPARFKVSLAYPGSTGDALPMLSPGGTVERRIAAQNLSPSDSGNDAYFCMAFAVQADVAPYMTLGFNTNEEDYAWTDWSDVTISGAPYRLIVAVYQKALAPGEAAPAALKSIALDKAMKDDVMDKLTDQSLQVQVLAVNASEFVVDNVQLSANEALEKALGLSSPAFNPF